METEDLIHQVKSSHHMLLLFKTGIYSRALTDEQLHLDHRTELKKIWTQYSVLNADFLPFSSYAADRHRVPIITNGPRGFEGNFR